MLADLQCDHTIGMELKNYPKLTSHMLKSINTKFIIILFFISADLHGDHNIGLGFNKIKAHAHVHGTSKCQTKVKYE